MKTIGIITYHHSYNYGTILQAYATQLLVEKKGYKTEFIDYQQKNQQSKWDVLLLRIRRIPVYLSKIGKYAVIHKVKKNQKMWMEQFDCFYTQYFQLGKKQYTDITELMDNPPQYDGYLVGSDQTWNPNVSNNTDAFYLSFVASSKKKGSYAPSIAVPYLTSSQEERFKHLLHDFQFLSCREKQGTKMLQNLLKKEVTNVLDPTLMIKKDEWLSMVKTKTSREPYILIYFLGDNAEHREFVEELSRFTGLRIVCIPISYLEIKNKNYEQIWANPIQFIELINGAEIICTDSFHGTMFSINFNKDFFSFCKMNDNNKLSENSRLHDALEMFGLSNRLITSTNKMLYLQGKKSLQIDYNRVNDILERERHHSNNYLSKMLQRITEE